MGLIWGFDHFVGSLNFYVNFSTVLLLLCLIGIVQSVSFLDLFLGLGLNLDC